jgi:hypothetical protein
MPELAIQAYLRTGGCFAQGGTLDTLLSTYHIDAKRHPKIPNLVLLKYNQLESPFSEQIVRECRGIILDEDNNWSVVSFAFTKFFGLAEPLAAKVDWNTAIVQEKADGSLATIFPYQGSWHVQTTGTPDAGGQINGFPTTFAQLFWRTYEYNLPPVDCGMCFFFELCSPLSRVVVAHKERKLFLLGARDLKTLKEIAPSQATLFIPGCPVVSTFAFDNVDAVVEATKKMNGLEQEGFVICDANFNRVKIKSPSYLTLHHAKDGFQSQRSLVEIARNGEAPEVIAAFPEYQTQLDETNGRLSKLIEEIEAEYARIRHIETQKEFALLAVKTRCSGALFSLRANKVKSVREYLQQVHVDNLMMFLGYR